MSSALISRKLLAAIALIALLAAGAYVWIAIVEDSGPPAVESADIWPPGRWHPRARGAETPEELARILSLPYTGTGAEASADTGVLVHDPERVYPGANLYTSGHAPEALLIDMNGNLLHRWRMPFERAFPDRPTTIETAFFRRAWPLENGGLLALFQGGGLVRLDRDSNLVWRYEAGLYNDLHHARDGRIYAIAKDAKSIPAIHPTEPVLEDSIVVLGPGGRLERRVSLLEAFRNSPFDGLLTPMPESGDIFHTNTVQLLEGALGDRAPGFAAGAVLVSLREVDIIAVIDLSDPTVTWARRGPWDAQHQPELLASGAILLFDNRGGPDGNSRVIELDPRSGEIGWTYPGVDAPRLSSPEAGSSQRLPNGNTLVTESEAGRALEVTPGGEVVWEFVSPHRGGARGELVATLFEVLRVDQVDL